MKRLLQIVLVLVAVLVIAAVAAWFYLDTLATRAIEKGGTYATGVDTTLDAARLAPFQGELKLNDLTVANPPGFQSEHFLQLSEGDVAVNLASLTKDTVRIPRLHFKGIDLNLEKRGDEANYQVIMANLQKLSGPAEEPAPPAEAGKQYIIEEVVVSDITVKAALLPSVGEPRVLTVKVPPIRLENVGAEDGQGAQMAQVSGIVTKAVLEAVFEQAGDILPAAIASGLQDGLAGIGDLGGGSIEMIGDQAAQVLSDLTGSEAMGQIVTDVTGDAADVLNQSTEEVGEAAGEVLQDAGDAINQGGKKVSEEAGRALEDLGGLLGGNKQKEEPTPEDPAP